VTELVYPTLDLFSYDLRESLGQSADDVAKNRDIFIEKLPSDIDKNLLVELDEKYFEAEYVELLGRERIKPFESKIYDGYFYPVRLSDCYALLTDCSLKESQQDSNFNWLKDLKNLLNEKHKGKMGTFGQTWLFSAQLSCPMQDYENIAKNCYHALMPDNADWENNKTGQSQFLGGMLFELWYVSPDQINITDNHHVIITLFPSAENAKQAADFYTDWLRLFHYHHKAMWAYGQSQALKKRLKNSAGNIQHYREDLSNSAQLSSPKIMKKRLDKAWEIYSNNINNLIMLDDQSRTIKINWRNYQKRLGVLEKKTGNELHCLRSFSDDVENKYLEQVKRDYANLKPGFELLRNSIEYIRARAMVREEERQRTFMNYAAIGGIGLAVGAIVASISGQFPIETIAPDSVAGFIVFLLSTIGISDAWMPTSFSIVSSVGISLFSGLLTYLVIKFFNS